MKALWFGPFLFVLAYFMTAALRRYALEKSIMDIPNARSSHSIPTPRGGGVAIVVAFLLSLPLLAVAGFQESRLLVACAGAGGLIALVGFMDDQGHIAARWRLLAHFAAAGWVLACLGGMAPLQFWGVELGHGWVGTTLAAFYLVWLLNLYNFMDGIDGIASVEAITVSLGACILYLATGNSELVILPLMLAAAVAGFLLWNFPPARIFMGDAGSGFLGIILGGLSLHAAWVSPVLFWGWLILLGTFIVDATFTLLRRMARGEKVYEAHRSHAYQFASRRHGRHLPVTLAVGALNAFWLLPIALGVVTGFVDGLTGVLIAYLPLGLLALLYRAGEAEQQGA